MKRQFQLARLDSGPDKGKIALCAGDVTLGTIGKKFELRKLKNGDVGVFANGEMIGELDDRSMHLVNWPLDPADADDAANDGDKNESPTNIRTRQHVRQIKEQHLTLTESFRVGMSLLDVARQFGYHSANDGSFIRESDSGIDVIVAHGNAWEHRPAGDPLNFTTGRSPAELFDHLEFAETAEGRHTAEQLTRYINRKYPLVQNLSDELGSAVLTYMRDHRASTYTEALREVTKANPILWEKHKDEQIVTLID